MPLLLTLLLPLVGSRSDGAIRLDDAVEVVFLAGDAARDAIVEDRHDPFFRSLNRLDVELRLAEPMPGATQAERLARLKKLMRDAVLDWTDADRGAVTQACQTVHRQAAALGIHFVPKHWRFVLTDGSEEANAAYTRHDAIVLPTARVRKADSTALAKLVAHETAHVLSRNDPALRDRMYAVFGFRPIPAVDLGPWLTERRITNPDGVEWRHALRVTGPDGAPVDVLPGTYSKSANFEPLQGRRLFDYLRFGLAVLDADHGSLKVRTSLTGEPVFLQPNATPGFYERIGRNTNYIIHPDEILADNLALLLTPAAAAPANPALLRSLEDVLREPKR